MIKRIWPTTDQQTKNPKRKKAQNEMKIGKTAKKKSNYDYIWHSIVEFKQQLKQCEIAPNKKREQQHRQSRPSKRTEHEQRQ